jgi:hypothetical protein
VRSQEPRRDVSTPCPVCRIPTKFATKKYVLHFRPPTVAKKKWGCSATDSKCTCRPIAHKATQRHAMAGGWNGQVCTLPYESYRTLRTSSPLRGGRFLSAMPSLSTAAHATSSETLLADKLTECPLFESIDDSDSLVVRCALAGVQVKTAWTLIASAIFAARTTSLLPTAQASADAQVRGHEQQQQQHGQRPHAPSNVFTCSSVRIITSSRIIVVINNKLLLRFAFCASS